MSNLLSLLSFLGIGQSIILVLFFFARRHQSSQYRYLCGLFVLMALIMLLMSLPNSNMVRHTELFEIGELSLTFVAGPLLYLFGIHVLGSSYPGKWIMFFHFTPFLMYLFFQSVTAFSPTVEIIKISVLLPMIHFLCYTLWLSGTLLNRQTSHSDSVKKGDFIWLVLIVLLAGGVHIAQWIRYLFNDIPSLDLVVPLTAFLGVNVLFIYGFAQSDLLSLKDKATNFFLSKREMKMQSEALVKLIEDEKLYIDPELTLDDLAKLAGMPSYKVSYLINSVLDSGFNELINKYRVNTVKKLLKDPVYDNFTIDAISQEAGFNSRSTFYNSFKKQTGMSPVAFRR